MIQVLLYPDALSMVGSMNAFEIYCSSKTDVVFALRNQGSSTNIVQHTYTPNDKNRVTVSVKDIILPLLSFEVKDSSEPYIQPNIMKAFVATVYEVGSEDSKKEISFSVIRAGVDRLADSAANFLKTNFLTWQPQRKGVTYYSPEFLTYYAAEASEVKCKAYIPNGQGYEEKILTLASLEAGKVYTVPVQYAIIAKLLGDGILPHVYEIWVEQAGERVTYVQQYFAGGMKSEEEEWFLFENSLGGVDCFRAYGNSENTAEHTHNVAEIEEDSEEYRVDTTRKFKKNTGFLDKKERQWLLDFFPSLGKYVYHGSALRKITVIESDVNYEAKELPSDYTFTYKYSDARPYLNISRSEVGSFKQLDIQLPDLGNFTIAPRLVECQRLTLSSGALFPVQNPYSEEWGVTTLAAIFTQLVGQLSSSYTGGGGVGHSHKNIDVLDALSEFNGYITYLDKKIKAGYADETDDFSENGKASKKILRKDIEDTASALIKFLAGAQFGGFIPGILTGSGGRIDERGNAEFESITSRSSIIAKELIVNRQTAMESNFVFTESGLVDSVEENPPATEGDNITYMLKLQKRWEGDFTAFKENDVILASVNALATGGKYYDMWMRVLSVNTVKNTIEVVCYPDSEVPSGANHPPCELARLIRWGNAVEEDRQSCWYISSSEGLLVWLDHVNKPIIDKSNYSLAIGKLPDALHFVFANYPLADKRDGAFYAKYLAVQNIIRTDYQGNVKQDVVDRGKWSLDIAKSEEPYRCIATEVHDVWHYGCRWRCLEDKTQAEPKYASTGWAFVEGNPEFKVEMTSDQGWSFDCDEISKLNDEGQYNVFTTLSFEATLYNRSVNSYVEAKRVIWTRDTGNVQEDNAWAIEHADAGFAVPITWKDLGTNADERWSCKFKVEVELLEETVQPSRSRVAYAESSIFV
nr:MAG TPA: tail protein [Caudoviricetes sp.]